MSISENTAPPRTALVTGAGRGIGLGVTRALLEAGWQVAALDLEFGAEAESIAAAQQVTCDVSDEGSVAWAFDTLAGFLEGGLGLLVNNAGVADPASGPVETLSLDGWNRWIGTNLTGAFLMVRSAVPYLRDGQGAIVNITSTRAAMSEPETEAYAASKGGLTAFTHALAVSLGPDIRVNAVAPGWIATGDRSALRDQDHAQHPAGRVGRPEDIAEAVLYLAGAGFTTGQVITVDGGMTRKMIYAE
ncbi:SDR family oxidoreductase [Litorisediminicola beolgyonensis]|uniref:SDR family oxidoreductase n=1 Tax=Litorisediminicola beolgyonensis TaxID=1173614 RepID=A0ABW3ZDS3_9RHOB